MIKQLWNKIIETSSYLKKEKKQDFKGEQFWRSFKENLIKINNRLDTKDLIWNYKSHDTLRLSFNDHINNISVDKDENGLIEWKHFLRQILWIPHKDESQFSFHRLMQIALNYGQLLGSLDVVPDDIKKIILDENVFLNDITKYTTDLDIMEKKLNSSGLDQDTDISNINKILDAAKDTANLQIDQTDNITTDVVETDEIGSDTSVELTSDGSQMIESIGGDFDIMTGGNNHKRYYIDYN
jgi:hypothetical protein